MTMISNKKSTVIIVTVEIQQSVPFSGNVLHSVSGVGHGGWGWQVIIHTTAVYSSQYRVALLAKLPTCFLRVRKYYLNILYSIFSHFWTNDLD